MKHSEMTALASMIFLAPALPKWACGLISILLGALSLYLSFQGN
jgi:hypothetical protein